MAKKPKQPKTAMTPGGIKTPPLAPAVAIGGSAGSVKALQTLFEEIPDNTGLAFVVITHLSPDHPSELVSILRRHTKLPVSEVSGRARLQPDHIFIIPPEGRLLVSGDDLKVEPFNDPRGLRAPIDQFFRSLGEHHGDGFAIILSGAGSDGAVGLKAIKEGGGVILVQDPLEAEFGAMPRSAIATGLADAILPMRELAARLVELAQDKRRLETAGNVNAENTINAILGYLRARTGHDFVRYKRSTVMRRLSRRMQLSRSADLSDYLTYLRENVEEVSGLFSDLLISVTTFFRDPEAFDALARLAIPMMMEEGREEATRVWVPGCATGEEAYSIAIALLEEAARHDIRPEIQIFATDLDPGVLATAREGRYPAAIEADVGEERLMRYFTRDGDHYRIKKEVRDLIVFAAHSLLKDPPFSRLDLISCRNLLIYLERDLQNQVMSAFHYALKPGRFLFLGSAETADSTLGQFRPIDREHRVYQATEGVSTALLPRLMLAPQLAVTPQPPLQMRPPSQTEASVHLSALEASAPPSILVDADHRIVHISGSAGRFLQPSGGLISTQVTHLARPELRLDLRAGLHRAFERKEVSLSLPVPVRFNGSVHRVLIHVSPVTRLDHSRALALICLLDGGPVEDDSAALTVNDDMVHQLQQDLQVTRERLRGSREEYEAAHEELRAANEELQSTNEEYRSTAEELETSKEELQSMNEELQTLNTELKIKLEGVSRAHSDLQNLMAATEVGTLFLDTTLRIKRFTPQIAQLFSITPSDEGRSISDFTHQLAYDTLDQDARMVLSDLAPREQEAQAKTGRWYLMRLRPYRTVDDRIDGVVVTFLDITERRRSEQRLRLLTAELDHRVKNILARVCSIVDRSSERAQSADELATTLKRRIHSMADTHALFSQTQWRGAKLLDIISIELDAYRHGDNVRTEAPDIALSPHAAQAFSMVLHELTTNALKHGALSKPGGAVTVAFTIVRGAKEQLRFLWRERGGPSPPPTVKHSYGLHIVEGLLGYELKAKTRVEFTPAGLECEYITELADVVASGEPPL